MPLYFFDIVDAGIMYRDDFGAILEEEEVHDEAVAILIEIARKDIPLGNQYDFVAQVRNEKGEVIYEAHISFHERWRSGRR